MWCFIFPCSHLYHKECIVRWFISNDKCPTCKAEYYLGDDDKDDIFDDDDYYFGDIDDDIYLHDEDDDYPYEGRNYINYNHNYQIEDESDGSDDYEERFVWIRLKLVIILLSYEKKSILYIKY